MNNIEKLLGIASDSCSTGIFTDTLSFVTDKYGKKSSFELSDEELSMVAGGVQSENELVASIKNKVLSKK